MIVLLTAFPPLADGLNASELVVKSLKENPTLEIIEHLHLLKFEIMSGNTKILENELNDALNRHHPDICIFTGQAPGRNKITLERIATNLKYFVTLDKAGNAPKGEQIIQKGSTAYWNTLPDLENIVSILEQNNIPAAVSNNCGTHLCNQIFYHGLHIAEINNSTIKCGFVHIPVLPQQVIKYWAESPFMPIEMSRKALSLIIKTVIKI